MKKICLYTFTGTGNTKLCGDYLKKHLEELGATVDHYVFTVLNLDYPDPNNYDLIGIGYPIHAFNIPEIFVKFLKNFKKANEKKKFFVYKTSGEPFKLNDASTSHAYRYLKKLNYEFVLEKHFIMPYNIMFDYDNRLKKQLYLYLDPLTKVFAIQIMNEDYKKMRFSKEKQLLSTILRIEYIAPKLNSKFVRINKKKCINCKMCINNCPAQAIYINKKGVYRVKSTCAMCMRCTLNCPTNAIKFGFMNSWKVNGNFNFEKLAKDDSIKPDFISKKTKGYFKTFRKYFKEQNKLLERYNIEIPVQYEEIDK